MQKLNKFVRANYVLVAIIILAIALRFFRLGEIPISLNHDETALGYNAYSLLKTGADEFGKFLPLSLQSFGDWKLPFYPIVDILPIILFGLTEFAVRLQSAIAGVVSVMLIYFLAFQLFQKKGIALVAAFLLAISPWSVFFSRIAYEANVATTLLLAGVICCIHYYYNNKKNYLYFASIFFGLTIFTYHAFVVFAPLFFFALSIWYISQKNKVGKNEIIATIIFLIFVGLSAFSTLTQGSIGKLSSTSLFDDQEMLNRRVNVYRKDRSNEQEWVMKLLHNKYNAIAYQVGQNYLASFSPSFLFDKGGEKFLHNIGNFGNFYFFDALLLIAGFIGIFYYKQKRMAILFIWFLIGPIPSAITRDAPSSTRLFLLLPVFILIMSYGVYTVSKLLKFKKINNFLVGGGLLILFLLNFVYFIDSYFIHMNYHRAKFFHYGYKEAVILANKYPDHKVIMFGPENFPYISFLFYNKFDPAKFRESVKYYPENYGTFYYVKSFDRFHFVDNIEYENLQPKTLYIDYRGIRDEDYKIIDPSGEPVFKYFFKESK